MKMKDVMWIAVGAAIGYFTVQLIQGAFNKPQPGPVHYSPVTM